MLFSADANRWMMATTPPSRESNWSFGSIKESVLVPFRGAEQFFSEAASRSYKCKLSLICVYVPSSSPSHPARTSCKLVNWMKLYGTPENKIVAAEDLEPV